VPPILFYRALLFKQNFARRFGASALSRARVEARARRGAHRIASRQSARGKYNIAPKKISTGRLDAPLSYAAGNRRRAISPAVKLINER
jgi:hypothetical protein